jgi:catalase
MGYSGHSLKFINKKGDWIYTQAHCKSQQGTKFITQEDSATESPDYSQKDLYEAIRRGDYPKLDVSIQTVTPKQAEELWEKEKINVFDLTHVWPQGKFPLRKIGEFTLNKNAVNYFAEVEQVAFSPSHLVTFGVMGQWHSITRVLDQIILARLIQSSSSPARSV